MSSSRNYIETQSKNNKIVNYSGVDLLFHEYIVLKELEKFMGKEIPFIPNSSTREFGFTIHPNYFYINKSSENRERAHRIKGLYLHNKLLKNLPPSIENLSVLEILSLKDNVFSNIPITLSKLKNLRELNFKRNQLKSLPPSISQLTKLNMLDLSFNEFVIVPPVLLKMPQIKFLWMDYNLIMEIPVEIIRRRQNFSLNVEILHNPLSLYPPYIQQRAQWESIYQYIEREHNLNVNQVINKIKTGIPPSEILFNSIELGKSLSFILEQISEVSNPIKESFLEYIQHKFSVTTNQNPILL